MQVKARWGPGGFRIQTEPAQNVERWPGMPPALVNCDDEFQVSKNTMAEGSATRESEDKMPETNGGGMFNSCDGRSVVSSAGSKPQDTGFRAISFEEWKRQGLDKVPRQVELCAGCGGVFCLCEVPSKVELCAGCGGVFRMCKKELAADAETTAAPASTGETIASTTEEVVTFKISSGDRDVESESSLAQQAELWRLEKASPQLAGIWKIDAVAQRMLEQLPE